MTRGWRSQHALGLVWRAEGIEELTPHICRHVFAKKLGGHGNRPYEASALRTSAQALTTRLEKKGLMRG